MCIHPTPSPRQPWQPPDPAHCMPGPASQRMTLLGTLLPPSSRRVDSLGACRVCQAPPDTFPNHCHQVTTFSLPEISSGDPECHVYLESVYPRRLKMYSPSHSARARSQGKLGRLDRHPKTFNSALPAEDPNATGILCAILQQLRCRYCGRLLLESSLLSPGKGWAQRWADAAQCTHKPSKDAVSCALHALQMEMRKKLHSFER